MPFCLISPSRLAAMSAGRQSSIIDTRAPGEALLQGTSQVRSFADIFTYLATSTAEGMAELTAEISPNAFGAAGP